MVLRPHLPALSQSLMMVLKVLVLPQLLELLVVVVVLLLLPVLVLAFLK